MKKLTALLVAVLCIISLAGCSSTTSSRTTPETQNNDATISESIQADNGTTQSNETVVTDSSQETTVDSKVLVAYFSRAGENYNVGTVEKGNTQIMAEMIAEETGGTLFKIETVTPYPSSYDEATDVAKQEQNDNARPELNATIDNFDDYDTIILGYPIWWGDMPMAMYTFLESYDFSGKTILPFNTHEGSGASGTVSSIKNAAPQATVLDGLAVQGKAAQESQDSTRTTIQEWLSNSGIND